MNEICCVFVCNKNYLPKFTKTCSQLIDNGDYKGDICLVIGDDLNDDSLLFNDFIINNSIIIKHFPDIKFGTIFLNIQYTLNRASHWNEKMFQYHKLYLFDIFFKRWNYVFYLDCGISIYYNIVPIIETRQENILLANSDAYPSYNWKLYDQFDDSNSLFYNLTKEYNLNIDYFQTTILLYDTSIIKSVTFQKLYNLALKYPISKTNDQAIIALYFTNIEKLWEQIPIEDEELYFYDFMKRDDKKEYIMVKY